MRLPLSWPKGPLPAGCGARMVWPPDAAGDVIPMTLIVRVTAIAGVLALAGCSSSSWVPSFSFLSSGANVSLTIESDPPGADAKPSIGPSCRTPCMIPVPADRPFTVNYSLNGYLPQVVQVGPRGPGGNFQVDVAGNPGFGDELPTTELAPNPVYAQLQPVPPPAPTKKGRGRPQQKQQPQR